MNGTDPGDSLAVLTSCFAEEVGAETALLLGWDDERQIARPLSQSGLALDLERHEFAPRSGFASRSLAADGPFVEELAPRQLHGIDAALGVRRITHGLGIAVRSPAGARGSLSAGFTASPDGRTPFLLSAASAYASIAGLCLDSSSLLLTRLVVAARYDDLTGLLNYASLREVLVEEIERSRRHGGPLSCCFVDLDGFKGVNTRGGHSTGNRVLATVGQAISACVRRNDRAARYGGDEFVIALPETPARDATVFGERVVQSIREHTQHHTGEEITASAGISQWVPEWGPETLLEDADRALMAAKGSAGAVVLSPLARGVLT